MTIQFTITSKPPSHSGWPKLFKEHVSFTILDTVFGMPAWPAYCHFLNSVDHFAYAIHVHVILYFTRKPSV